MAENLGVLEWVPFNIELNYKRQNYVGNSDGTQDCVSASNGQEMTSQWMAFQSTQVAKVLKQSLAAWEENTDERWEEKLSFCEALPKALLENWLLLGSPV